VDLTRNINLIKKLKTKNKTITKKLFYGEYHAAK